jgi:signal transduction histidine kinase
MRILKDMARMAVLAALYFGTARFGLLLDAVGGVASSVWPPTGISLAALLIYGRRLWPGVALGAFLANLTVGEPFWVAMGIGMGNTLEAFCGAFLLQRVVGFENSLERVRDVIGLILLAAIFSTAISATIGTTSAWWGGVVPTASYGNAWWTWWLGDMMGDLVLAPALLTWSAGFRGKADPRKILEAALLLGGLIFACQILFGKWFTSFNVSYSLLYLVFPFMIWAALNFGPPMATLAILLASVLAIWRTAENFGPFVKATLNESLLSLQTFMGVVAVTALLLAAAVAERKKAEEKLKQKTTELESSNEELEHFASGASHDLQEPLLKILAFGDLLKNHASSLDEKGLSYVERMQQAGLHMRRLIDDLLQFSKAAKFKKTYETVDLNDVVKEVLSNLEVKIRESKATFEVGNLPALRADSMQMHQLFQNLISNALKFREKEKTPLVKIFSRDLNNGSTEISVEDNGIGFEERYLDQIFEPFERLHSRSEYEGTGMGLALCKKIVERHGGTITAKSDPAKGSAFVVTLPL